MMKTAGPLLVLLGFLSTELNAQVFNRPVPTGFPQYEFRSFGNSSSEGHYLLSPMFLSAQSPIRSLAVLDDDGYLEWFEGNGTSFYSNFEYHPSDQLFSFATNANADQTVRFYLMDEGFNLVDSILPANNYVTDIHECRILANGNYLITGTTTTQEDLSAYTFGGVQGANPTTVLSLTIQEFQGSNLVFDWRSIDHVHPSEFIDTYNYNSNLFDYVHGNAVEEDVEGNFLVSHRHLDAIHKIDRTTGNVVWRLGGALNDFTFTNDDGFSGQHDVRVLANGNLSLFDNGNSQPTPRTSRAIEYELNYTDMTATRVWQYTNSLDSYSRAMGSYRILPDGERIMGYGFCNRPVPNFIHMNEFEETISELLFQDSVVSYRVVRPDFEFAVAKPEITCEQDNGIITLSAPSGLDTYKWSTGEETQQIEVPSTGTFQVWVNEGIGMIGSEPFFLTDLSNPCSITDMGVSSTTVHDDDLITFQSNTGLLQTHENGTVSVLNVMGQIIINEMVSASSVIDITTQPKGIYIIRFESDDSRMSVKRFLKF